MMHNASYPLLLSLVIYFCFGIQYVTVTKVQLKNCALISCRGPKDISSPRDHEIQDAKYDTRESADRRREPDRRRDATSERHHAAVDERDYHGNRDRSKNATNENDQWRKREHEVQEAERSETERLDRQGSSTRHQRKRDRGSESVNNNKDQRRSPSRDRQKDGMDSYEQYNTNGKFVGQGARHYIRVDHVEDRVLSEDQNDIDRRHLDPSSAANKASQSNRRKVESMLRNDSLSSDPSDCVRPPPPKPHKHKRGKKQRQQSFSSSDDEIRSTPECSSCEEGDLESESVSEKGELLKSLQSRYIYIPSYLKFIIYNKQYVYSITILRHYLQVISFFVLYCWPVSSRILTS